MTEESARLPSAIAATLTVLLAFAALRRPLGEHRAFLAALLLPVSVLWLEKVPSAEIDILQLAWVAASLFAFLRGVEAKEDARRQSALAWWMASLMCVAGGFLTKWTAPAFFYLAVTPFLAWRGRLRWLLSWEHLSAVVLATGVCAGWALLVANEVGWSVLRDTVLQEAAQRFAPKSQGKPYPWGESLSFPAAVIGANLPWSIPALLALRPKFLRSLHDPERRLVQLMHCWAWPNLLFWSLPAQHNVRYVLPICPAISLLGIYFLVRRASSYQTTSTRADEPEAAEAKASRGFAARANRPGKIGQSRRPRRGASLRFGLRNIGRWPRGTLLALLVAWVAVKIVHVEWVMPARTADRNARETGSQLNSLVPKGQIVYLCRLKDEGVLFYYGRPARRLAVDEVPGESSYILLLNEEWQSGPYRSRCEHVAELKDQQKATIHLVRVKAAEDDREWPAKHPTPPTSSPSVP